jgi:hypothetical protein
MSDAAFTESDLAGFGFRARPIVAVSGWRIGTITASRQVFGYDAPAPSLIAANSNAPPPRTGGSAA